MIPVQVDYSLPFPAADQEAWEVEYQAHIKADKCETIFGQDGSLDLAEEYYDYSYPQDWIEELELMEPEERKRVLEELAARPDLYSAESEVIYG